MSKNQVLDKKILEFYERQKQLLQELELEKTPILNFAFGKPRFLQRLAVNFLEKSGAFIDEVFNIIQK